MDMKHGLTIFVLFFLIFIVGCSPLTNYYEFEEGLFCIDNNRNDECDKDEPKDVDVDPKNLYEFETGKFCIDADDNKVCDDEEVDEPITTNAVNNSSGLELSDSEESEETDNSGKTEHEICLETYDIEVGSIIYRDASWNPFDDDSYADNLKEAGYTVYDDVIGTDKKESYEASNLMTECFAGAYS